MQWERETLLEANSRMTFPLSWKKVWGACQTLRASNFQNYEAKMKKRKFEELNLKNDSENYPVGCAGACFHYVKVDLLVD